MKSGQNVSHAFLRGVKNLKYIEKVISWLNQQWVKVTVFILSACLTLFYFIFPNTVCGLPFLITSAIILGLALLFYYREKEAEMMRLLSSFVFSIFGVASFFICFGFINIKNNLPVRIKAIEIITLILGVFGAGIFTNTVQMLIHERKARNNKSKALIPITTIISIIITVIGLVTAIINWSTALLKVHI